MHFIPILDIGIAKRPTGEYAAYDDGVADDVFLKAAANTTEDFIGQVWPGDSVFPDFFNTKAVTWWQTQLSKFHDNIAFDGLWEDMNEVSNFCTGACYSKQKISNNSLGNLPYQPTGRDLNTKSLDIDAVHAGGLKELDTHSLYGTMEVKSTHEWFASKNKRTMIIERSGFAGVGKFASRWLGDNFSTKEYMGYSVTGVMMHNILGVPLSGSDICGFIGNTTEELCTRWHVVGAFYPFSRNHNTLGALSQEPW